MGSVEMIKLSSRCRIMTNVRKLSSLIGCALIGSSIILTPALSAAKPPSSAKPHRFDVGGSTFAGLPKTICVIEGTWSDGEHFRFEAWDKCSEMRMRRLPFAEYENAPSLGTKQDITTADIPAKA